MSCLKSIPIGILSVEFPAAGVFVGTAPLGYLKNHVSLDHIAGRMKIASQEIPIGTSQSPEQTAESESSSS